MSKKILKRSLALGALMAFVITGQAWAEELPTNGSVVTTGNYTVDTDTKVEGNEQTMIGQFGTSDKVEIGVLKDKTLTVVANGDAGGNIRGVIANTIVKGEGKIVIKAQGPSNVDAGLGQDSFDSITANEIDISSTNSYGVYTSTDGDSHTLIANTITISGAKHAVYSAKGNVTIKDFTLLTVNGNTDAGGLVTAGDGTMSVTGVEAVINGTANSAIGALDGDGEGTILTVNVDKLTATSKGLGTETGAARKHGAIAADGNSTINLNVKDSLTVNVKESAAGKDVYGIMAGKNYKGAGTININADENANNTADITINVSGDDATGIFARRSDDSTEVSSVVINGNSLTVNANVKEDGTIDNTKAGYGIWVANGTDSQGENTTSVEINTQSTTVNAHTGLVNYSAGNLEINNDLTVNSTIALSTRGNASTTINKDGTGIVKLNGNVEFGYDYDSSRTAVDADVNINLTGAGSEWNGNTVIAWDMEGAGTDVDTEQIVEGLSVSKFALTVADGAQWNPNAVPNDESTKQKGQKYTALNNLELNDGVVNVDAERMAGQTLEIEKLSGSGGTFGVASAEKDQVVIEEKVADNEGNAPVVTVSTTNQELALDDLVGVVSTKNNDGSIANAADIVEKAGGSVYDKESATVDENGTLGNVNKEIAAANVSVNDMAAIGLMSWRAEMNDMNKRMGELRNANGEHGVWVRMVRGESEYNSVKNQYNQYQLGYDEKLSVDKRWTVGVALSYTDAENNFAQGTGESTNKALSIYGSKLNDDGTFIDLIAKYARLENDFTTYSGQGAGEYDANGYSFSAEFGKRIQQGKGLWIEPQVELTYGKVGSAEYVTEKGVNVAQDGMESLVGRVGFSLGKDIKDGNVYARASYLYDFDGETKATLNNDAVLENDLGGGWWEVGVGANINLSKATYIYADIEKTFGGEVDTNWQWNLGVRYSF